MAPGLALFKGDPSFQAAIHGAAFEVLSDDSSQVVPVYWSVFLSQLSHLPLTLDVGNHVTVDYSTAR